MVHRSDIQDGATLTTTPHVSHGAHVVYTYTVTAKYMENVISYVAEGLDLEQTVIYIDRSERFVIVKNELRKDGYSEEQMDAIVFADTDELFRTYDVSGEDGVNENINQLIYPYLQQDGTVRLWRCMTQAHPDQQTSLSRLTQYEGDRDWFIPDRSNVINVCAYNSATTPTSLFIALLKTHEYHMTDINLSPSHLYNKKPVLFPSISDQIKLEKTNQEQAIQSEKLSAAGELASGVAHELRNPLTVMKGYMQIIDKIGEIDNKSKKYLRTIRGEMEKMEQISSEFLSLAKPHSKHKQETDITQSVENVKVLMEPQAVYKGIEMETEIDHDGIFVICDEMKVKQVFVNLIKNAIEAMDQGYIRIAVRDCKTNVHISVTDNGPGIPDDTLKKLKEPFMTTKESGTGLGLVISEKITEDHGGRLVIESEVGKGTTFTVSLPKS